MALILRTISGVEWISEHRFTSHRKWEFDFAEPRLQIAIECEGGTWINGRHNTGVGYAKDCEKYNNAALLGWTVLRYTTEQISRQQITIRDQIKSLIQRKRDGIGEQYRLDMQLA